MAAGTVLALLLAGIVIVVKWTKKNGDSTEVSFALGGEGNAPKGAPPGQAPQRGAPDEPAPNPKPIVAGKIPAYPHGTGRWKMEGDELVQANADADFALLVFGDPSWTDYDMTVDVQRVQGNGSCRVAFRCQDCLNNYQIGLDPKNYWATYRVDGKGKDLEKARQWLMGGAWHTVSLKLRGRRLECFIDGQQFHSSDKVIYLQGYVWLFTVGNVSMRFRNLKITDKDGRPLVGGARDLDFADRPGSLAARVDDEAKAGTVWRGKLVKNAPGKDEVDMEIEISRRDGMDFEGELWIEGRTRGFKIEGRIDGKGNIIYVPTRFLGPGRHMAEDLLGKWQLGALKDNKVMRCVYFTKGWPDGYVFEGKR
jgi:hypothetical protein